MLDLPHDAILQDLFVELGIATRLGERIFASDVNNAFQVLINNVAVNRYDHKLSDNDSIMMFPPMAGGSSRKASEDRRSYVFY
jgi:molybdopterin converting factor small subunit